MIKVLRESTQPTTPDQCALLRSEDQLYGISRGVNRLGKNISKWTHVPGAQGRAEPNSWRRRTPPLVSCSHARSA